jgi:hypothetical protein
MSVLAAPYFVNEPAAYEMLETELWPNGPICPRCQGQSRITPVKGGRIVSVAAPPHCFADRLMVRLHHDEVR